MNGLPLSSLRVSTIVALASFALAACGPDDAATVGNTPPAASQSSNGAPSALNASISPPLPTSPTGSTANAFNTPSALGMSASRNARNEAQDNGQDSAAILSAQASLAADSQQVAPVLRYAPGDDTH
ncbi:hypothetical protein G3N95_29435 [Paraburkholderia sp. Tr-20389]|uniref:hypothetical protein n=1 Tax=Paraburkholderia sp. Tr-20389 TaxID=2703903 RepID=UPI00197E849B|nr:hypothetical protein [Paraburkholderia sp. Tr-20389]MBN3757097.1 hypothetical protein [Paraburkholderia sp. Tr-20389]